MKFVRLNINLFFGLIIFIMVFEVSAQKIKVACVGDSVTFGLGIEDGKENSYPAQLQNLLGNSYEVGNFGHSGTTVLKNGHKPYWTKPAFKKSKEFAPNIVIIHLGLNDQGMNNWPDYGKEFVDDYLDLIATYRDLPTRPKVIICKMTPTFSGHHWFEEGMRESFKEIQSKIEQISKRASVDLIDLHNPLYRFPEFFPDNLHPTKEGVTVIAKKAFSAITGNFGGLKLPVLYGERMVIQRNEPIVITGIANTNDKLEVILNGAKKNTKVGFNGTWKVTLPAMEAGGPYKLTVKSEFSEEITIQEVYLGEVWLASGQSNMAFDTKNSKHAKTILKDSINTNIHLFSFDGKAGSGSGSFNKGELENCNSASYFDASGWQQATFENVEKFSAIAYAFGYNIQKELGIHVGIISNAVGGSPTQSWISRESMEQKHETIDLLNDTRLNPMVQPWVSQRKEDNFKNKNELNIIARHPFDPTMLFDAGINPIKDFNIKGVIWYQGESNAERVELHEMLFKMLVKDWRMHWNKPEMPFYYVQLSSLDRPNWGAFRDSQRRMLLEIPNSGLAVSSDVGNPKNVHPIRKWVVGDRLSKIALANVYDINVPFSGPLFDYVNVNNERLEVYFKHGKGLKTSNGIEVIDMQIAGVDKVFVMAESKIIDDVLEVWSSEIENPRFVKYGYSPYTEANLVNEYNLPAATFSNLND